MAPLRHASHAPRTRRFGALDSTIEQPSQQRYRYGCNLGIVEVQLGARSHNSTPSGGNQRLRIPPPTAVDVLRFDGYTF